MLSQSVKNVKTGVSEDVVRAWGKHIHDGITQSVPGVEDWEKSDMGLPKDVVTGPHPMWDKARPVISDLGKNDSTFPDAVGPDISQKPMHALVWRLKEQELHTRRSIERMLGKYYDITGGKVAVPELKMPDSNGDNLLGVLRELAALCEQNAKTLEAIVDNLDEVL